MLSLFFWTVCICIFLLVTATTTTVVVVSAQEAPDLISSINDFTTDPNLIAQQLYYMIETTLETTPSQQYVIIRFDRIADDLVKYANTTIEVEQERINYVMNGLQIGAFWSSVLYDPSTDTFDLSLFVAAMLGLLVPGNQYGYDPYPGFLESRQQAQQLFKQSVGYFDDLDNRIETAYDAVQSQYDNPIDLAPIYQVTYGYQYATNAQTTGVSETGRCIVVFNIGAQGMLEHNIFQSAAIHETWHCVSGMENDVSEQNLLKLSMREGVATYLTSQSNSNLEEHEVLLWSKEELLAAQERKNDIIEEFANVRYETNRNALQEWMILNRPLSVVPGAPSRCAYYVAYLAFQAYVKLFGTSPPSAIELLDLSNSPEGREIVWEALVLEEGENGTLSPGGNVDDSASIFYGSSKFAFRIVYTTVLLIMTISL